MKSMPEKNKFTRIVFYLAVVVAISVGLASAACGPISLDLSKTNTLPAMTAIPELTSTITPLPTATIPPTRTPTTISTISPLPTMTAITNSSTPELTSTPQSDSMLKTVAPGWIALMNWGQDRSGIDLLSTDGSRWEQIIELGPFNYSLSWSPNGDVIVFDDGLILSNVELYTVDISGGTRSRITYNPGADFSPAWSPDGRSILFVHHNQTQAGNNDILWVDLRENQIRQLTFTDGWEDQPTWSPDGKLIAFLYTDTLSCPNEVCTWLATMKADGSDRKLNDDIIAEGSKISWSPDGSRIAFSGYKKGSCASVYLINPDGSGLEKLTNIPLCTKGVSWSPDGQHLAFVAVSNPRKLDTRIFIMNADGTGMTQLSPPGDPTKDDWELVDLDWSPMPALLAGYFYTITDQGANLNVRTEPSLQGELLYKLGSGDKIKVIEGPIKADGYSWMKITSVGGQGDGWIVEIPGWFAWDH